MTRIRSIHPDAFKSEKLHAASAEAERCYWRLLPHCDDDGRAEDDPVLLRAGMFPRDEELRSGVVDGWLQELEDVGLLIRYEVDGRRFIQVTKWCDYQKPQKKIESKIPAVPADYAPIPVVVREESGTGTVVVCPVVGEGGTASNDASPPTKRGTRIPDEFRVSPEMQSWADEKCPFVNWRYHTERFVNYWKAKPGRDAAKLDWERTWRNWMLEEQQKESRVRVRAI